MKIPKLLEVLYRVEPPTLEEVARRIKVENARTIWIAESTSNLALAFVAAFLLSPVISEASPDAIVNKLTWIWIFVSVVVYWYGHWVLDRLTEEN